MNKESRRNFVKKTAVLSTATLATTLPVDAFANVTENKKLKIVTILLQEFLKIFSKGNLEL